MWTTVTSMAALAGTVIYSKYQIFRKEKIIDEKDNEIKSQKDELHHLRNEAKELNK
jgi:cell division protein FtsL